MITKLINTTIDARAATVAGVICVIRVVDGPLYASPEKSVPSLSHRRHGNCNRLRRPAFPVNTLLGTPIIAGECEFARRRRWKDARSSRPASKPLLGRTPRDGEIRDGTANAGCGRRETQFGLKDVFRAHRVAVSFSRAIVILATRWAWRTAMCRFSSLWHLETLRCRGQSRYSHALVE